MWIRERKAGFTWKTGECRTGMSRIKALKWIRTMAAAGIILTALGVVPGGKAGELFSEQGGAVLRVQAAQADGDEYFGRLDTFTGEKLEEGASAGSAQQAKQIWITDNMFYDTENKAYGYPVGEEIVYSNVADGMIVKEKVSVKIPETVKARLYWEGNVMDFPGGNVSRLGSYTVEVINETTSVQLFSFMIVGNDTNQVVNFSAPEGFRITRVTLDGTEVEYTRRFVDMAKEGYYIVSYECSKADLSYKLDVNVDTTPPTLVIEGVDEDGKARGPVAITGKVDKDTLVLTKNGEEYSTKLSKVLTQSGRYVATVTDPAGNSTTYRFTILLYLDKNAWIFSALFLLVVLVVVGLFIYYRKHLRVR